MQLTSPPKSGPCTMRDFPVCQLQGDPNIKRSKYTEETIIGILKERQGGMTVADLTRKYGVSEQSIYRWQAKYGGMEVSEAKRLRQLEEENARLKRMVADLSLDKQMLEDVLSKKW